MTLKVAVIGAAGRMGSHAIAAVQSAEGMEIVAQIGRGDALSDVLEAGADVAVELTVPASTEENVSFLTENGVHCVVGTTGWTDERLSRLRALAAQHPDVGILIAPNFSIGAVLAMQFAELAAPYFDSAEVIEIHHPRKLDAPSGTALSTAKRIARVRRDAGLGPVPDATESDELGARGAVVEGIHVHAVRQAGMNASEEIHFGSPHEGLMIRTDSHSTEAFMPGIITAVRAVADHPGVTVGLENYL